MLKRFWTKRSVGPIVFEGNYNSWEAARKASTGYQVGVILERTRDALLKVKRGEAVYERDSVLFDHVEHSWPLLAGLQKAALANDGKLSVLDFGGSLGSSYFQCRGFLAELKALRWSVVEQSAVVKCGKAEFEDDRLKFYETIEDCLAREQPAILLLSSVLSYLEQPHQFLRGILHYRLPFVLVDSTLFLTDGTRDRLCVQRVPPQIYPASYPCWLFNLAGLQHCFHEGYELVADFRAQEETTIRCGKSTALYRGFLYTRSHP
jgi:putative methyltransferase (TIGR04325 family)